MLNVTLLQCYNVTMLQCYNVTLLQCYNVTMAFCSFRVESQSLSKHKSYEISKISLKTSGYDGHSLAS